MKMLNAINTVMLGDCVQLMAGLPSASVDFILTDPPYLVNYRDRSGGTVTNDDEGRYRELVSRWDTRRAVLVTISR